MVFVKPVDDTLVVFPQSQRQFQAGLPGFISSALLTTTMAGQKDVIDALIAAGIRDSVKVMVGGAPVTQAYADEIGADCYTLDAASAAQEAKKLLLAMQNA